MITKYNLTRFFEAHSNNFDSGLENIQSYMSQKSISHLYRPLFVRFLLFRFDRFAFALSTVEFQVQNTSQSKLYFNAITDRNFEREIGSNTDLNFAFLQKDRALIDGGGCKSFEEFLQIQDTTKLIKVSIGQSILFKWIGWPKCLVTDRSVNVWSFSDLLSGSIFIPSYKEKSPDVSKRLPKRFFEMSLRDEFAFFVNNQSILAQPLKARTTGAIVSSKAYLSSKRFRNFCIKVFGEGFTGRIVRHGGVPATAFTEEQLISQICGFEFVSKFSKTAFVRRYKISDEAPQQRYLMALYTQSPFTSRFRLGMTKQQYTTEYLPDQKQFFHLAQASKIENQLYYRIPDREGSILAEHLSGVQLDTEIDIRGSLSKSKLMVCCYDSSLPLHLLTNEKPFFLFWRKHHWPYWPAELYDMLQETKLLHEDPESLFDVITKFEMNGREWWYDKYNQTSEKYKQVLFNEFIKQ